MYKSGNIRTILSCLFLIVIFGSILMGCASTPKKSATKPSQIDMTTYNESTVKLNPGDVLDIRFFYSPSLNVVQAIRPDGIISLELIGEVKAQGKTPKELRDEIYKKYSSYIKELDVTVIVQSLINRVVYVGGQVTRPGTVQMHDKLTVLEALMLSGGVNLITGGYENVLVLRNIDGKWLGTNVDIKNVFEGKDTALYYLQPMDIVYVPETRIYEIDRWIDQNIRKLLPDLGFTYTFIPNGPDQVGIYGSLIPNQ
jgi:polysaccharide biosynthesis/export protein